ncbi:hypothetical protein PIB30_042927 [Stylosanthes scabra]|uniref:Uncharacterized protein n=1 Tax=Stylosanthes scabra TaxID=79078 RepID=A0ABU6WF36_9FABA|nr:hypothetical protein [Stylosanthes scabra]
MAQLYGRRQLSMTLCLCHFEYQVTDPQRKEGEALRRQRAETRPIYHGGGKFRGVLSVEKLATRRGAARSHKRVRPTKKNKATTLSNGKGKATLSLSQPPPSTSTKKKKAAAGVSSSQPIPTRKEPNTTPTWPGRARRGAASNPTSHQPPIEATKKMQNLTTNKSSKKPSTMSSSQPNKKIIQTSDKPSSSQPVGTRPLFCVSHVGGGPHVPLRS